MHNTDRTVQTTQTDVFARESWAKSVRSGDNRHKIVSRIHYQLVTNIAGFRLSTFKGSKELLSATFDVFTGKLTIYSISQLLNMSHPSCDGRALESKHHPPGHRDRQHHTL